MPLSDREFLMILPLHSMRVFIVLRAQTGPTKMRWRWKAVCGYMAGPNRGARLTSGDSPLRMLGPQPAAPVSMTSPSMETTLALQFSVKGPHVKSFLESR